MAKKKTVKVTKLQGKKVTGFSLKILLAVIAVFMSVVAFDLVENFLNSKKTPKIDWSNVSVEQQIDAELKNAQEAIKLDVSAFESDTLGK